MYFSGFANKSKEAQCEEFMDEVRNVEIEELLENGKFDPNENREVLVYDHFSDDNACDS